MIYKAYTFIFWYIIKTNKELAMQELAIRELEKRYEKQRGDLLEFIQLYFQEERPLGISKFALSPFHYVIADRLHQCFEWKITRLIINIPPGHGKTELITKSFPVWALWNNPHTQIIATWYSTTLTQWFSSEANQYYASESFRKVFPRNKGISQQQNTKEYWKTIEWGWYYATGTWWTITGKRANIFLIDDPIKPDEADKSTVIRDWVNSWFSNTVPSRLFNPETDCIIIVQQRTHDDDLSGFLINKMNEGREKWEVLSMPAIAERDETRETRYWTITRKEWEPLDSYRFPISAINKLKEGMNPQAFSSQYMQNPINKEAQEFHEEWFLYHKAEQEEWIGDITPKWLRVFTTVDPAFKQNQHNDDTCIMTGGFMDNKLYVLEYTAGKFTADVMQEKIIYHIQKWSPEKVGIEAFQAQSMINVFLKQELQKRKIYANIEEVKQTGDKESKIRKLLALYKNWLIYHKIGMDSLENQLKRFPKWAHDDIIDALQMLYDLYTIAPQSVYQEYNIKIDYDANGIPIYS